MSEFLKELKRRPHGCGFWGLLFIVVATIAWTLVQRH